LEPFAQGLRFDPGGDAFDVAWRERASILGTSDAPPPMEPITDSRESDPAASAVDRARARAGSEALPEQPTLIRARAEAERDARPTIQSPEPAILSTPTMMADPQAYAAPTAARRGEPTETFARPPLQAASSPTMVRALAPWIALAIVTAIVMVAAGIALVRLL